MNETSKQKNNNPNSEISFCMHIYGTFKLISEFGLFFYTRIWIYVSRGLFCMVKMHTKTYLRIRVFFYKFVVGAKINSKLRSFEFPDCVDLRCVGCVFHDSPHPPNIHRPISGIGCRRRRGPGGGGDKLGWKHVQILDRQK